MSDPFKQLSKGELELFAENGAMAQFMSGELIFKQNAPVTQVTFLRKGCVKLVRTKSNEETVLELVISPNFLGLANAVSEKKYSYSAIAVRNSEVCFIEKKVFDNVLNENGQFASGMLRCACIDEMDKFNLAIDVSRKQISGKVARILLYFSDVIFNNQRFKFPLTRLEVANLIGVSVRSLTRILGEFERDGIIKNNGLEVTLVKEEVLKKIAQV